MRVSSLNCLHGSNEEDSTLILFLDFDGVTHPEPYDQESAFQQLPFIEAAVRDLVEVEIVVSRVAGVNRIHLTS